MALPMLMSLFLTARFGFRRVQLEPRHTCLFKTLRLRPRRPSSTSLRVQESSKHAGSLLGLVAPLQSRAFNLAIQLMALSLAGKTAIVTGAGSGTSPAQASLLLPNSNSFKHSNREPRDQSVLRPCSSHQTLQCPLRRPSPSTRSS